MRKVKQLPVRFLHPDWRLDIAGPTTLVLTSVMGHRCVITLRVRRKRRDGPWMHLAKWLVPMVIWIIGMWMAYIAVLALALRL